MYFKSIELTGFKSFADRTVINLENGMTAVVGPNGCGKSNILDAMRWALGEQKPKILRGAHMQDIIFNGTDLRAPMGMAEVTLTFDNSDGTLPIDFAEVQVTRRLYRSGESDYLINKAPCLLRDIQELFMDTGIGTNAYSMIGQGKIGMVLSSKPEDRRFLFEEASGIIKYKSRKRIAMRKLELAGQNLLRLGDIVGEVERQMRSLKRQVNAAIRHRELSGQLRDLEIRASWLKQQELLEQLETLRSRFTEDQDLYEKKTTEVTQLEARHEEMSLGKLENDRVLHARREAVHDIDVEMEKIERQVSLIRQQIDFSIEQRARAVEERDVLSEQAGMLKEYEQDAAARAEGMRAEHTNTEAVLESQQSRLEESAHAVTIADLRLEELRAKSVQLMKTRAENQTAMDTATVHLNITTEQLQTLGQRCDRERARDQELAVFLAEKSSAETATKTNIDELQHEQNQARGLQEGIQQQLDEAKEKWQGLREKKSSAESRLSSLRELRDSYAGFAQGVQAIMQAHGEQQHEAAGVLGPLGDLISTREHYECAVEAALGGSVNSVVIEQAQQAVEAIRYLKDRTAGRATFLPLDTFRATDDYHAASISEHPGVIAPLLEILEFEERLAPILRHLIGDTVLVENIGLAMQIVRTVHPCPRLVTLAGDLIEPYGAMTGGESGDETRSLLGRRTQIEETKQLVEEVDRELAVTTEHVEALATERDTSVRRLDELTTALDSGRTTLSKIEIEITQITREREKLAESEHALGEQQESLRVKSEELNREGAEMEDAISTLDEERHVLDRELAESQANAASARQAQSELAAQLGDLRVQAAELLKSIDEMDRDHQRHQEARANALAEIEKRTQSVDDFTANSISLENEIKDSLQRSEALSGSREEARGHVVEAENQRQALLDESESLEKRLKTIRDEANEAQTRVHKTEIDLRHDEDQLQFFQERILSEYNIALASLSLDDVGDDEHDEKERDRLVGEIRERLDRIGTVNLMAIEEYEALTERHEFLVTQQQDLQDAREALLSVVERIDGTITEMFLETFNAVAENFREYFRRLFNGGQARIYLLDEDDPLESGIEIEARPPGKKPQSISLLSGGEQAMTAIALLFGIFKAKPSPFCVLDEVDAPLDDANIGRFVELVDEFSADTQFVVITHNKQTMARASALYGITQQERGVSQIVSVRFDDVRENDSAA